MQEQDKRNVLLKPFRSGESAFVGLKWSSAGLRILAEVFFSRFSISHISWYLQMAFE